MTSVPRDIPAGRIPEAAERWLEDFLARAPENTSLVTVVVTGSAVRPVARSQDLDLLVVHSGARPALRPPPPIDVDVRFMARDDLADAIAGGNEHLLWTITHGSPLFDRDGFWAEVVETWGRALPLPAAERSLFRSRRASRYAAEMRAMGDAEAAAEQGLSALTHLAWARLLAQGVLPLSRPEIPEQLRRHGETDLADELARALVARPDALTEQDEAADPPRADSPRHQPAAR